MLAVKARRVLKYGRFLEKALRQGRFSADTISPEEHRLIEEYKSGELQEICNEATRQHGHGKIVLPSGEVINIGGSTGGKVRRLLDGEDRTASAGASSQRVGEEASGGSPGSAAGAASQRAGEEASGDEESSGPASASASSSLPSPVVM